MTPAQGWYPCSCSARPRMTSHPMADQSRAGALCLISRFSVTSRPSLNCIRTSSCVCQKCGIQTFLGE